MLLISLLSHESLCVPKVFLLILQTEYKNRPIRYVKEHKILHKAMIFSYQDMIHRSIYKQQLY